MRIERVRSTVLRVTLHTYELAALVSAARWAEEGGTGELPEEVREELRHVLASYETQLSSLARVDG